MITIRINKKFLDNYRQYKIDLVNGEVEKDINYTVLEHIISNGVSSLSELYEKLDDNRSVTILVKTGEVVDTELSKEAEYKLNKDIKDMIKGEYDSIYEKSKKDSTNDWDITYH